MDMRSIFVGGTGTDVGKTYVSVRIVEGLRQSGFDVGVMKPYSAGMRGRSGLSGDIEVLADAAGISPVPAMNPHHQSLEAPPYVGPDSEIMPPADIISEYRRLAADRDIMVVEGMGGLLVPILSDYYMVDLAMEMGLRILVVADNVMGTIHNVVSTLMACHRRGAEVGGIVLNMIRDGYDADLLLRILGGVIDTPVLAILERHEMPDYTKMGAILGMPR